MFMTYNELSYLIDVGGMAEAQRDRGGVLEPAGVGVPRCSGTERGSYFSVVCRLLRESVLILRRFRSWPS